MTRTRARPASLWILLAAAALPLNAAAQEPVGVVVQKVPAGRAAEKAGLRVGDRLVRWQQGDASGALQSPFELADLELEYGPRGPVQLLGRRGEEPLAASLLSDDWGLDVRPVLSEEAAAAHAAAGRALEQGSSDAAVAGLQELRARLRGGAADVEPWLLLEVGRIEYGRRRWDAVASAIQEGVGIARSSTRPAVEAQLLTFLGWTMRDADRLQDAAAALEGALAVRRRLGADSLATASLAEPISLIGVAPRDERRKLLEHARGVQERLAPESLALARTLSALGFLLGSPEGTPLLARAVALGERLAPDSLLLGRFLYAAGYVSGKPEPLRRALAIQDRLAPLSPETALSLSLLGRALHDKGDIGGALSHHQRALRIVERFSPETGHHSFVLNYFGLYWQERGDFVQAEPLYRRALHIEERRSPQGFGVARGLYNLGRLLAQRREIEQAEASLKRAADLAQTHGYGAGLTGRALYTLGGILRERGELAAAEAALRRAVEVLAPGHPAQHAIAQEYLADTLADRGRYEAAEALYRQTLDYARRVGVPIKEASRHHALGALALRRGDLDTAERQHRAALELRRQHLPQSVWHAESSHELGVVALKRGRQQEALELFREAVAALEAQGRRLGGSEETRTQFRAHYHRYYRDLEELLLDVGREEDAFEVVERSRARGLLALLASRDLALGAEVPEELEQPRRRADAEHDRVYRALQVPSLDAGEREKLGRELDEARRAQEEVRARIRIAAPRAAALRDPDPLGLAGIRRALEPGTLLLVFSLGAGASRLYALGPGPDELAVIPLAAGADALAIAVRRFREAIDERRSPLLQGLVMARSLRLTELLLQPVSERVRRAERLLVVPDGPLHLLPFAALRDPSAPGRRYLVESKPLTTVSSVTLYDTLTRSSPAGSPVLEAAVGFGDPIYAAMRGRASAGSTASPALVRARAAGLRLPALPATRREVEALRTVTPGARLWLGAEATEERAKNIGREARLVHFACHGFLDEQLPLESGLALTIPPEGGEPQENGLLQAWEVLESLRLEADLVTLSACQTALGRDMAGEGLMGLTWAFQYAGARSVLASLWEVNDASTAELMRAFYRDLAAGVPKAEALRRAQLELRRRPATSAPWFWAAFTLIGANP